ncbi:MmcQ/YjbR family DNA-binding protein [Solimonas sp. K1W22B-7]|uniref:MmcQ/YjbR family DNA-binding protein n=1 Tax=Solimonas sp. K1W22B-7 TaxID=2303331 RepID=UPI001968C64D|nr:MmcQ/YjbR family DNA-binding protein [Solimonas sp. K1W22B-7]
MGYTRAQMERACGKWPGVTIEIKWETNLVFSVGAKMFAIFNLGQDGYGRIGFKVDDDLFLPLTEQPGIMPAPYLARARWVRVFETKRYPPKWFEARLRRAYELVAAKLTKKARRELDIEL